ncbi:MAG: beta-ketoacyl synthase N-terminal-like domain-containing protein, partial [Gammaproteobacteria bacterium]
MTPLYIGSYTLTCAIGQGMQAVRESIAQQRTGLHQGRWSGSDVDTWLGAVNDLKDWPSGLDSDYSSRNNLLAYQGLLQDDFLASAANAKKRYGADRCAIITGTSTSSIGETEAAFQNLSTDGHFSEKDAQAKVHHPHATTEFLANILGVKGPAMTISTACSSSAKVFASAARWIECGIADTVIVGGVDSLCLSVIHGFNSLQLIDTDICKPFDQNREGINLGEAAGFAIVSKDPTPEVGITLNGFGESCDAYHMSSAHPDGLGAEAAMRGAIERAGIDFAAIDYLNMHGTGTRSNDTIEGGVCARLFPDTVRA